MKIKLKLWQRVVLVTVTAIVPMACITFYVISSFINKDIDFGQQEAKGNTFQRPLETLLDLFPRYQATAVKAQAGDAEAKAKLADLQQQIDKGLATLGEVYQSLGADLKFSDAELAARKYDNARLSVVQADWQNLKNAPVAVAANGETTGRLVTSVRTMITHSGDTSNLILDPDLDSYYLMDVTLCALPQTQERLSTITLQVSGWLRTGTAASKKSEVAVMAAMLNESDLGRITGDVQTVLSEDKNFYGTSESLQKNLPAATDTYAAACTTFVTLLQKVAAGETVDPTAFENAGWAARAESFKLWETSVGELDHLLTTRVASIQHKRLVSYASIAGTVLLNVLVIWLIVHRLNWILRTLTGKLSESSDQLAAASRQISRTSQGLAEGAGEQAASLQETSASLEEMASMTRRNAQTAQGARDLATQTRQTADSGMQSTGEMIKAMDGIRAASAEMHAAMNGIKAASGDVSKIIKTIDEIAFQTNILALNAAVEAARAGEAGMGFAVVADEVRNLAQRSAKAAHETAEMIETSIKRSEEGVKVNEKVQVAIDEVAGKSKQVGERLREIVARVQQMDEAASEVALASKEQSSGISQINIAVSQMDKAVQGSAASAEEAASSAEELSTQAAALQEPVADLLQLVGAQKKAVVAVERDPIAAPSTEHFSPNKKKPARASSQAKASQSAPETEELAWAEAKPVTPAAGHKSEIPMDGDFKDF